jgi:hypothetical protein
MTNRLINSAALYFRFDGPERVPILWLTRAIEFFSSQGITLDYFDIGATETFSPDETYDFENHKHDLFKAVKEGLVESVGLYSNPDGDAPRSAWRAMVSLEMENGMIFLGIDEARLPQHGLLLRSAYLMDGELLGVKYGISYKQLLARGPECYAAGVQLASLADIKEWLRSDDEGNRRLTAWLNEQSGQRRYLTGLFRGAYPASILSNGHVEAVVRKNIWGKAITLRNANLGKLEALNEGLWIWQLSESEIPQAEEMLEKAGLIIRN